MRHSEIMQERLRRCVDNEMLMYSTLAYGSMSMAWMYGRFEAGVPPEYFHGKALQAIRANLPQTKSRPDTWLLLSIYAMAITDMWHGIPTMWHSYPTRLAQVDSCLLQSSRTHLKALNALVQQAGGWTDISPYVLESAILADKYLAAFKMKPTVIPVTWDPGPIPPMMYGKSATFGYANLRQSFMNLRIDPRLQDAIQDVVCFVHIAQGLWYSQDALLTAAAEGWLFKRLNALTYRLWLLQLPKGFEDCVRHTVLLFLSSTTHYRGGYMGAAIRVHNLKLAWTESLHWPQDMDQGLYLWCVCTAALTPWPCKDRQWFRTEVRELTSEVATEFLMEHIETQLLRYLYLPDRQEVELQSLVRSLRSSAKNE
ncbi:MAG: hypothetical protein Q9214_005671 [Letrouitia sp. 1 TL-2023]